MTDFCTLAVSIFGLILSVIYFVLHPEPSVTNTRFDRADLDILLEDYRTTGREVERRENITLAIGTIFVAASFLLLSNSLGKVADSRYMVALASILLYSLWLFIMHWTSWLLDNASLDRMRAMERRVQRLMEDRVESGANGENQQGTSYRFGIHTFLHERTGEETWMRLRRAFWGFPLLVLSLLWLFASIACK